MHVNNAPEKKTMLVHCGAGVSRSATVVIAYLMVKEQIGVEEAMAKVKAKRKCVDPNSGFLA